MSTGRQILDPKISSATILPIFDFSSQLDPLNVNDVLQSVTSVTVTVWTGVDANPNAIYAGTNTFTPAGIVQPKILGGVPGVIYLIAVTATALGGQILVKKGLLAILPDGAS